MKKALFSAIILILAAAVLAACSQAGAPDGTSPSDGTGGSSSENVAKDALFGSAESVDIDGNAIDGTGGSSSENVAKDALFGSAESVDIDGNAVDGTVFSGHRLTVVNIWGTFCGPCINEMPGLAELSEEYADKDVVFIGIPVDVVGRDYSVSPDMVDTARKILAQTGVKYLQVLPSESLGKCHLDTVMYIPETIFLDSEGRQIGESYIGSRQKSEWAAIIDNLLAQ